MVEKGYITYNQVHNLCQQAAPKILNDLQPNLIVAIGGGGYVPARILRSFLKKTGTPNIPIQAIGLSLYEDLGVNEDNVIEEPGTKVTRTQWLDLSSLEKSSLVGKRILIVDEVDDTRTTLEYAVSELKKDIKEHSDKQGRSTDETTLAIFVLHNKDKAKKGSIPDDVAYLAARTVPGDLWICYPWEATNIDEHDQLAVSQKENSLY